MSKCLKNMQVMVLGLVTYLVANPDTLHCKLLCDVGASFPLVPVFLLVLLVFAMLAACAFKAEEMPSLISCWMAAKVMAGVSDVDVLLGGILSTQDNAGYGMIHEDGDNDANDGDDDEREISDNSSLGTKKYRGSNNSDGGNTRDGVKIAGEVIGSVDEIGFSKELKELLSDEAGKEITVVILVRDRCPVEKRCNKYSEMKADDLITILTGKDHMDQYKGVEQKWEQFKTLGIELHGAKIVETVHKSGTFASYGKNPDDQPMWESAKTVAPTPNAVIFRPGVDDNFVINNTHLKMILENKFDGQLQVDPHEHIREFLSICNMFKYGETQSEAVKLLIFPFSL
ncbi:hypothetical protein Tco_0489801 [Tanacetum coccineum]